MKISKFLPSRVLMPFVKEFMIIESEDRVESNTIPNTSIVMAFRYCGSIEQMMENKMNGLNDSTISGLRNSVRLFCYSKNTANLLVLLREGGLVAFSGIPAHELYNQTISSEHVFPLTELKIIIERLNYAKDHPERINMIENFLTKKLSTKKSNSVVTHAVKLIGKSGGIIKINELAFSLNTSQDVFEKHFRSIVGTSPKQYSSIVRMQNLIKNRAMYTSLTEASYDAGFFDQSHFIKNFRQFTGKSPKDFFKTFRYL